MFPAKDSHEESSEKALSLRGPVEQLPVSVGNADDLGGLTQE